MTATILAQGAAEVEGGVAAELAEGAADLTADLAVGDCLGLDPVLDPGHTPQGDIPLPHDRDRGHVDVRVYEQQGAHPDLALDHCHDRDRLHRRG